MRDSDALALKNDKVPKCFTCFRSLTEGSVSECLDLLKSAFSGKNPK